MSDTMYEPANSELASEDWVLADDKKDKKDKMYSPKPVCLVVQLRRVCYLLPYFRFVYASGDQSQVHIEFSSHVVTVSGHGLAPLLVALAELRVSRLIQPSENEVKFGVRGPNATPYRGSAITAITVEEVVDEEAE